MKSRWRVDRKIRNCSRSIAVVYSQIMDWFYLKIKKKKKTKIHFACWQQNCYDILISAIIVRKMYFQLSNQIISVEKFFSVSLNQFMSWTSFYKDQWQTVEFFITFEICISFSNFLVHTIYSNKFIIINIKLIIEWYRSNFGQFPSNILQIKYCLLKLCRCWITF